MKLKKIIRFLLILIFSFSLYAERLDIDHQKAFNSITAQDAYDYCKTLSAARFAGRYTGTEGFTASAKWVANKFKEWRLKPINKKEGYLQSFPYPYTIIDKGEMTLLLAEKKSEEQKEISFKEVRLEPQNDFFPILFSDSGSNTVEVTFAGWGISAPELGYDDYAALDVKGKFVLLFQGTPDPEDNRYQKYSTMLSRVKTAKEKGALGILYIYSKDVISYPGSKEWIKDFCSIVISEKVVDMILKEKGITFAELKKDLQTYRIPLSFPLNSKISYRIESRHFPDGIGYNVVGYVEGSDPRLKKEYLLMLAHLDHTGQHMGFLFAGAHDNASGSAVVMEVAEAFSKLEKKPKRSLIFILFGAEEGGLMTSKYFAEHIPPQFEKVDAIFNFDMVGVGDGASCSHNSIPEELKKVFEESDKSVKILKEMRLRKPRPGSEIGVPHLSFVSDGGHTTYPYYHRTTDTIFRINPDVMADIARLAFLSAYTWENR